VGGGEHTTRPFENPDSLETRVANTKSAEKAARRAETNRARNVTLRSRMRTALRKVNDALAAGNKADAMAALKGSEDLLETLNVLFLVDADERLTTAVPLARLFIASGQTRLRELATETLIQVSVDERQDRVTELFDKYNLLTLPVVDEDGKLAGVITADDIISVLRQR